MNPEDHLIPAFRKIVEARLNLALNLPLKAGTDMGTAEAHMMAAIRKCVETEKDNQPPLPDTYK